MNAGQPPFRPKASTPAYWRARPVPPNI
jgi:hypothetical protein